MSQRNQEIDLDGFPVLRIDQIPQIDTKILEKAQHEVSELIIKLNSEGDKSQKSFVYYLNKQLDEMEKEIAKRIAEARVLALLNGSEDGLHLEFRSKQPIIQPPFSPSSTISKSSASSSKEQQSNLQDKPRKFEPIPLPSELRKQSAPSQLPQSSRSEQDIELKYSKSEDIPIENEIPLKRPKSGQPSRRSLAIVEENFGSSFVVGAVEKRKRFYPKKVQKETEGELREKNRESRRQLAMKRLLERKEQQIARQEASKKKKLLLQSEKEKSYPKKTQTQSTTTAMTTMTTMKSPTTAATTTTTDGSNHTEQNNKLDEQDTLSTQPVYQTDSDSEESLSGDDRDEETEIPEAAIQNIIIDDLILNKVENTEDIENENPENLENVEPLKLSDQRNENEKIEINKITEMENKSTSQIKSEQEMEEKSSAALSTLRMLKLKKMQSQTLNSEHVDITSRPEGEGEREREGKGEPTSLPQSPDLESSDLDSNQALTSTSSLKSFDQYFLPISSSIITSIIENDQTVYICSKGPDDLPGLKAWTLVSTKSNSGDVKWIVNSQYYEELYLESQDSFIGNDKTIRLRLLKQRGKARRAIAYGLVILSRMCESLILGDISTVDTSFEMKFRQQWGQRLAKFDDVISQYHSQDKLYQQVMVCGNLYAVCKKLENLLRTSGVSEIIKQIHENETLPTTVKESGLEKATLSESTPIQELRGMSGSMEAQFQESTDAAEATETAKATGVVGHVSNPHETFESTDERESESQLTPNENIVETVIEINDLDDNKDIGNDDDDDDDDDALLPGSNDVFSTRQRNKNNSQNLKSRQSLSMTGPNTKTAKIQTQVKTRRLTNQKSQKLINSIPQSNQNNSPRRITDIIHNIAGLFPAVQSLLRNIQKSGAKSGDHESIARTLIECMTLQVKLYEEWVDIMDDYATVFCHDRERGIPALTDEMDNNSLVYSGGSSALHYRVQSSRTEVSNIITDVLNNILENWVELPQGLGLGTSWNLLWSWSKPKINTKSLLIFQRINHFLDSKQLTRKDLLKKNLSRLTDLNMSGTNKYSQFFEIMPKTFLLPNEYTQFVREFTLIETLKQQQSQQAQQSQQSQQTQTQSNENMNYCNIWIMKPVGLSRGRGISLINNISSLTYSQNSVLQKYLDQPLCLNDYKFDLRLYILVTSFHPLEAFIYRDGFARLSTEKYSLTESNLQNKFIHLTNSSIQKHNNSGVRGDNPLMQGDANETNGSKIPLLGEYGLWKRLQERGYDLAVIWEDIKLLIIKSLVAVDDKINYQPCSFELFGYDILLDRSCRPWLIEVNSSPSLERGTQLDIRIKNQLITDIIQLISPISYNRSELIKILKLRLKNMQSKLFSLSLNSTHDNTTTPMVNNNINTATNTSNYDNELEAHLKLIIGDQLPRQYGEEPAKMGQFEKLCPNTKNYNLTMKYKNKLVKEL